MATRSLRLPTRALAGMLVCVACGGKESSSATDGAPPVGDMECPRTGDTCPTGCFQLAPAPITLTPTPCLPDVVPAVQACTHEDLPALRPNCVVSPAGVPYASGYSLWEPHYAGWRRCTEAEAAAYEAALVHGGC